MPQEHGEQGWIRLILLVDAHHQLSTPRISEKIAMTMADLAVDRGAEAEGWEAVRARRPGPAHRAGRLPGGLVRDAAVAGAAGPVRPLDRADAARDVSGGGHPSDADRERDALPVLEAAAGRVARPRHRRPGEALRRRRGVARPGRHGAGPRRRAGAPRADRRAGPGVVEPPAARRAGRAALGGRHRRTWRRSWSRSVAGAIIFAAVA